LKDFLIRPVAAAPKLPAKIDGFSGAARDGERPQEVEEHLVSFEPL